MDSQAVFWMTASKWTERIRLSARPLHTVRNLQTAVSASKTKGLINAGIDKWLTRGRKCKQFGQNQNSNPSSLDSMYCELWAQAFHHNYRTIKWKYRHYTYRGKKNPLIGGSVTLKPVLFRGPCAGVLSHVRLSVTPWTVAFQAPLSAGFSRQEYWSGLPFPSPMHESEMWKWSCLVMSNS